MTTSLFRWVQRLTPLLPDAARFARHAPGDRWFVDETYVKVSGVSRYVYRAVDQDGQVIDVLVSTDRDAATARRFLQRALAMLKVGPSEVVTDAAPTYPAVIEELIPSAWHHVERRASADAALAELGVRKYADVKARRLSLDNRQRVGLAATTAHPLQMPFLPERSPS